MPNNEQIEALVTDLLDNMKTPQDSAKTIAALLVAILKELQNIQLIMKEGKK